MSPDVNAYSESDWQLNLSQLVFWLTRGKNLYYDRVSQQTISHNSHNSATAGPDGSSNSAFSNVVPFLIPDNATHHSGELVVVWYKTGSPIYVGVTPMVLTTIATSGSWKLGYCVLPVASNLLLQIYTGDIFDVRLYSPLKSSWITDVSDTLNYLADDVINHAGINTLPAFNI
jgi:hypothetical protein